MFLLIFIKMSWHFMWIVCKLHEMSRHFIWKINEKVKQTKKKMPLPGFELGTQRILNERFTHYTTYDVMKMVKIIIVVGWIFQCTSRSRKKKFYFCVPFCYMYITFPFKCSVLLFTDSIRKPKKKKKKKKKKPTPPPPHTHTKKKKTPATHEWSRFYFHWNLEFWKLEFSFDRKNIENSNVE